MVLAESLIWHLFLFITYTILATIKITTIRAFIGDGNTKNPTIKIAIAKGIGILRGFCAFLNINLYR